jgi:hypothetical protein
LGASPAPASGGRGGRAFRSNSSTPAGSAGFPLQSLARGRATILLCKIVTSRDAWASNDFALQNRDQPPGAGRAATSPLRAVPYRHGLRRALPGPQRLQLAASSRFLAADRNRPVQSRLKVAKRFRAYPQIIPRLAQQNKRNRKTPLTTRTDFFSIELFRTSGFLSALRLLYAKNFSDLSPCCRVGKDTP